MSMPDPHSTAGEVVMRQDLVIDPGALFAVLHIADRVRRRAERVKAEAPYPRMIVVGDSWLFILHPGAVPRVVDSAEALHLLQLEGDRS